MIITLKDGSTKEYSEPKSIIEIAADISEGLARMACAGEVNGEVEDLRTVIDKDCNLSILTFNDEGGKAAFRHTTSHIMAQAIKRLYPDTKLAIGPSIEDGFYYDIDRETPLVAEDLEKIEAEMKKIVKELMDEGKTVEEIGKQLGMRPEEIFRLSDFSKEDFLKMMTKGVTGYSKAEFITKI